jgi:diadenosine tetraphosphate (Ap4A) HIT family hydrolase
MNELDLHYPADACPFCTIAAAYPPSTSPLWTSKEEDLLGCVPAGAVDPEKTSPGSFVVLASRDVVAFLDILPMVGCHLLVATRGHRVKVGDMEGVEGREMGEFTNHVMCCAKGRG